MKRDGKIDLLKGIGILLVVLGHCISTLDHPVNQVILSFHMPLFFFCSGLTLKTVPEKEIGGYLKKKIKAVIIPQVVMGTLSLLYDGVFLYLILHKIGIQELSIVAKGWFTQWFLLTLFMCFLVWAGVQKVFKYDFSQKKCAYFLIGGSIVLAFLTGYGFKNTLFSIEKVPTAFMFMVFGFYVKEYLWGKIDIFCRRKLLSVACLFCALFTLIGLALINAPVEMYRNYYGDYWIFFITSILGIVVCSLLACMIRKNRFIELFGANSIVVFVTHFVIVKFIVSIISNISEKVGFPSSLVPYVAFLLVIMGEMSIVSLCNRYIYKQEISWFR